MTSTSAANIANDELKSARQKLAQSILEYIKIESGNDLQKAVWLLSSALSSKLLRPAGQFYGRLWYSDHDKFIFVKPAPGQPYRQRDFCSSAKFLFILIDRLRLTSIDDLFLAAVQV